jgi:hypothetical protein
MVRGGEYEEYKSVKACAFVRLFWLIDRF